MRLSSERLLAEAGATGFRAAMLEKTIQLVSLLEALNGHPALRGRWALKGGTALNLFHFELPRLSVDADLNYVGAAGRDEAMADRPSVEGAMQAVFAREEFQVARVPTEHAGGKWRLRYASATGSGGNLEVDLNLMLRVPLWTVEERDSVPVGSYAATRIPLLERHELAAGKLAALLSRHVSRDLFDSHQLLTRMPGGPLGREQLRLAFVVYGGMNRKDWRTVSPTDVDFTQRELEEQLLPVLRTAEAREAARDPGWAQKLVDETRAALAIVLPLNDGERAFLDRLLDDGEIVPELLTNDPKLRERIAANPMLRWKQLNVRRHRGPEGSA
jgi:predicted nucleotidyltransferase component of viral defense system